MIKNYLKKQILCVPTNGKRPLIKRWTSIHSTDRMLKEVERLDKKSVYDFGVICGEKNQNLVGFDIDLDDSEAWQRDLMEKIVNAIPNSSDSKRGKKGLTLFYRSIEPIASQSFKIDQSNGIDILSSGRQSILPPSIHPDTGKPYEWDNLSLVEYGIENLPIIRTEEINNVISLVK